MDLKIKIIGTEMLDDGRTRLVTEINNKDIISIIVNDTDLQNTQTIKNTLTKTFKSKSIVGSEFVISV